MQYDIIYASASSASNLDMLGERLNVRAEDGYRVIDVAVVNGVMIYTLEKASPRQANGNGHHRRRR